MRLLPARRSVAVVLVAFLLAGCGSSDGDPDRSRDTLTAAQAVRTAAEASQQDSSRIELISTTSVGDQNIEVTGAGVQDPRAGMASFKVDIPNGGSVEMRLVDGTLYLALPGQPGFSRLDADDLAGTPLAAAAQPTEGLSALEDVDDVEELGEEQVREEPTTHYRGTIDAAAALKSAGGTERLEAAGVDPSTIEAAPVDVWIDGQQRVRRFEIRIDLPGSEATGGQTITTSIRIEQYDFGVDVNVEAPPADQVQDGGPLLDQLTGGAGG